MVVGYFCPCVQTAVLDAWVPAQDFDMHVIITVLILEAWPEDHRELGGLD